MTMDKGLLKFICQHTNDDIILLANSFTFPTYTLTTINLKQRVLWRQKDMMKVFSNQPTSNMLTVRQEIKCLSKAGESQFKKKSIKMYNQATPLIDA